MGHEHHADAKRTQAAKLHSMTGHTAKYPADKAHDLSYARGGSTGGVRSDQEGGGPHMASISGDTPSPSPADPMGRDYPEELAIDTHRSHDRVTEKSIEKWHPTAEQRGGRIRRK